MPPVRIAVDAMGGDRAPEEIVAGALEARSERVEPILFGRPEVLTPLAGGLEVVRAEQAVAMDEKPSDAARTKRNSSMFAACRAVGAGEADAVVSAGNTGALLAACLLEIRRLPAVRRPALAAPLPAASGPAVLVDAGANADARPEHLVQFAHMGATFAEEVLGITEPKVGLLSIGEEPDKGNHLVREAYALLFASSLRFVGNVESRELLNEPPDVIVCDGFTGNVALKALEDVEHADLVFIIGGNPASNHPRLMRTLMGVRRSGGDVIVVNPIVETGLVNFAVPSDMRSLFFGTKIASIYVQPHIGGDLALLTGIAKRTLELGAADAPYLAAHADGWPEWKTHLENLDWQEIYRRSGVAAAEIDAMARRYAAAKRAVFGWTMGITHHVHGVENVQAIVNLALLRGMVGRPGAGLMPIRGHSNVQGIGSVGVTPKLKEEIFTRLQQHFGIALPRDPGLDTMGSIEAAAEGRLKVGVCLGGNLYGSNPDAAFAHSALGKLDLLVYMNTTLNTGHAHGLAAETIILPVLARDEEPQPTTQESMFNYVRLSDGGPARHIGPRSEVQIVADLAHRVLGEVGPVDWRVMADTGQIRQAMSQIIPGWEKIHDIDRTREEFHITGRTFREPTFSTPSGKARLHVVALPDLAGAEGELRLMTIRSEGQFNTVVYEEYDLYRGQDRRDIILMHPEDATRLGLRADQRVTITSEVGSMSGILVRPFDRIKQGNAAMYYPEANVLVPRHLDPASRTPAFKNVLVRIEPDSAAGRRQPVAAEDVPAERVDPAMLVGSAGPENMRAC